MKLKPNNVYELMSEGGQWLAKAREQMQHKFVNGDTVEWGSQQVLKGRLTVKDFEEMAAHIAYAAIVEFGEDRRTKTKQTKGGE